MKGIPTITEKASKRKKCKYCGTGKLHQHIVVVDKGIRNYIESLGKFKDDPDKMRKIHCEEHLSGALDDMPLEKARDLAGFYEPEKKGKIWEVSMLWEGCGYTAKNQFEAEVVSSLEMIKGMLLKMQKQIDDIRVKVGYDPMAGWDDKRMR